MPNSSRPRPDRREPYRRQVPPGPVVITSRIFSPEPSAASFRLLALANVLFRAGNHVKVLTSKAPPKDRTRKTGVLPGVVVRRAPVLRDSDGYVRGYAQYMSFDVPLGMRLFWGRRPQLVITEPPPTTGAVVRIVCALRRVPYAYYAADIWSDAVRAGAAPKFVANVVRRLELFALKGATHVLSVSEGVSARLKELGIDQGVHMIGNGVDLTEFQRIGPAESLGGPYFLYAGTASEVHGAKIFLEAFADVLRERPDAILVFLGQGSEREEIETAAKELAPANVRFLPREEPAVVARWLRGATASLASVRPGQGYDFAFPTKLYASAATGTPAVYAGPGPGVRFIERSGGGIATEYSRAAIKTAMINLLNEADNPDHDDRRERLAAWAETELSLEHVAARALAVLTDAQPGSDTRHEGSR